MFVHTATLTAMAQAAPSRARRLISRGVRALPRPVADRLRRVARALRGQPEFPPSPEIAYPADVADVEALREYLSDTDAFGPHSEEAAAYLNASIERFRITAALVPSLPRDARVLELGANPYFITRLLLRRGLDVTCANWFGEQTGVGHSGVHKVNAAKHDEHLILEYDHFNVETERFPYDDGSFDLVLCCEILEHLPNDPTHVLAEIHRVLRKPEGTLLLTTPNALRLGNLILMQRGDNVYEELSGYGTYGRHNREYTVAELHKLLEACGYRVERLLAADIGTPLPGDPIAGPGVDLADRGENLFAVARPFGEERWPYPRWLYSSRHALQRIVRPDLRVGCNDDIQSAGLHESGERDGLLARWTGADDAVVWLAPGFSGAGVLRVEGTAPPAAAGAPMQLEAEVDDQRLTWEIPCDGKPFTREAEIEVRQGQREVHLRTDRTWTPSRVGAGDDARVLGVAVARVALNPTPGP
jgi:SAM-dependent methyltransferase